MEAQSNAKTYSIKEIIPKNVNWVLFILFSILSSFVSIGLAYLIQLFSSIVIDGKSGLINTSIFFLVGWTVLSLITRYLYLIFKKRTIFEWNYSIKSKLMENILSRIPMDFRKKDRSYYVSIFNNDIKFVEQNLILSIAEIIGEGFLFVGALVYCFSINYMITLTIVLAGISTIFITNTLSSYASKDNKTHMDSQGIYNEVIDDGLRGYHTLYKSNALFGFIKLFNTKTERAEKKYSQSVFSTGFMNSLINQVSISIQSLLFLITTLFIVNGYMDVVYFPVMMSLMNLVIYPMYTIMSKYGQIKACKEISMKLVNELNFSAEVMEMVEGDAVESSDIIIENLDFSYGDKFIFKDVDLHLHKKEHILLRGNSGSGKSTLLRLLTRESIPKKGNIYLGTTNSSEMSRHDLFRNISVISQHPMLFRDTILQNIVLFKDEEHIDHDKLNRAIKDAGLNEFIDGLEEKLQTVLLDSGENLSGGEKQRIEVARAIYKDSPIILIDEATSGLDLSKAVDLENIFREMDRTIISTSHREDIDLSKLYDKIYYINEQNIEKVVAQ